MQFELWSWRLQEYMEAIKNKEFFVHVMKYLRSHENQPTASGASNPTEPDCSKSHVSIQVVSAQVTSSATQAKICCDISFTSGTGSNTKWMTVQTKEVLCNDKGKAEWGAHDVVWLEVDKHAFLEIQVIAKAEGPAQTIECMDVTSTVRATSSTEKTYQSPGASRLTFVFEHITPEERVNRLVTSKHYVAGGSARLMFKKSSDQVIAFFDAAMRRGKELLPLFQVAIGDTAEGAINSLLARYDDKTVTIVSRYASQRLAIALGPSIIDAVKNGFDIAPFMVGGFLEILFFLMLRVAGVPYHSISADGKVEQYPWEKATAVPVDTTKFVLPVSLDKPIWLAPVKWNQGGYVYSWTRI